MDTFVSRLENVTKNILFIQFYSRKVISPKELNTVYSLIWIFLILDVPQFLAVFQLLVFHLWLNANGLTTFEYVVGQRYNNRRGSVEVNRLLNHRLRKR